VDVDGSELVLKMWICVVVQRTNFRESKLFRLMDGFFG